MLGSLASELGEFTTVTQNSFSLDMINCDAIFFFNDLTICSSTLGCILIFPLLLPLLLSGRQTVLSHIMCLFFGEFNAIVIQVCDLK